MARFIHHITVNEKEIDSLNHVNNEVYLKWLITAAEAHSLFLGYGIEKFLESGCVFVVRRHELDYLLPAYLGEKLRIETWVSSSQGARSMREYQIIRESDQKVLMDAKTPRVYIDLKSGRPTLIPKEMSEKYMAQNAL